MKNDNASTYPYHTPVLLNEVLEYLHINTLGKYVDATVGAGGHAAEIIARGGQLLGFDTDPNMLEIATKKLSQTRPELVNANFRSLGQVLTSKGFAPLDGILFDLGISSVHFDDMDRGFSFKNPDAMLDMRLDPTTQSVTAANLINSLPVPQLINLFELGMTTGEARRLAFFIDKQRRLEPIETVGDFLRAGKFFKKTPGAHPATKAFMALRIAVNTELENLTTGLTQGFDHLKSKGRMVVISFHSGEDRIVKNFFKQLEIAGQAKVLTKKPIKPSTEETTTNPRARSAVLRAIEKI